LVRRGLVGYGFPVGGQASVRNEPQITPAVADQKRIDRRRSHRLGLLLWLVAVGLGLGAQYLLTPLEEVERGAMLFALAGISAALSVLLPDPRPYALPL
jgi:hypothetical protein